MSKCLILAALGTASVSTAFSAAPLTREIKFKVPDLELVGTFESPASPGKHPAILLLPGSGPTDRDGNSGLGITTDVLKTIADTLAENGIASFRFDKRAIRHYAPVWPKGGDALNAFFGWQKFVDDAAAGLDLLRQQPEVDPTRVGMLGHSEGSLLSLQVAANRHGKPNGPKVLVLLGCTGRPMGIVIHEQIARSLTKSGAPAEIAKPYLDYTDAACKALAAGQPLPPNPPQGLESLFNATTRDIVGAYCRIDPTDNAKLFSGPALVINGGHDTQVSAERDTPRLVAALKARHEGTTDSFIAPNASHNLKSTAGGNDDAFSGPIAPGVLEHIVSFLKAKL